jgi:hypothetical protein
MSTIRSTGLTLVFLTGIACTAPSDAEWMHNRLRKIFGLESSVEEIRYHYSSGSPEILGAPTHIDGNAVYSLSPEQWEVVKRGSGHWRSLPVPQSLKAYMPESFRVESGAYLCLTSRFSDIANSKDLSDCDPESPNLKDVIFGIYSSDENRLYVRVASLTY